MDEAERLADRVAIMDHGKLLEIESPDALRQKVAPEQVLEIIYDKEIQLDHPLDGDRYKVSVQGKAITVVGENLIAAVPEILEKVTATIGTPITFNLSRSSLEDVFIKLTGRSLRE